MNENLTIGDLIEVPPVQTVIRLEEGKTNAESIITSFVFTSEVASHFSVLAGALLKDHGRGFFLQGDFGSGKSHFLATLAAWLSQRPGSEALSGHHGDLHRVTDSGRKFLVVDVSLVKYRGATPLERIIVEAIESALGEHGVDARLTPLSAFLQHVKTLLDDPALAAEFADEAGLSKDAAGSVEDYIASNPRKAYTQGIRFMKRIGLETPEMLVEERYETFQRALTAVKNADFHGLVILIDELSEFFRSKPDARSLNEDARALQLLGELTLTEPVWIVAAVQESIERTGDISQVTFQKIKDRFPVKFVLSTLHIKALISRRLVKFKPQANEEIFRIFQEFRRHFSSFTWPYEEFRATYPVHPLTIDLLDGLGDLFSEHRGIVDFVHSRIAGDESRQIQGILDRSAGELLGPDSIYEHFSQRIAEFSGFHIYPRHVLPHLDDVIDRSIDDPEDRALARRVVRVLVLYKIHPTADTPAVSALTELVTCTLSEQDPDLNVQFIAEAILDVIVDNSRFLTKRPSATGDPLETVYTIETEEDPGKTLKARISRAVMEIPSDDTRLLSEVFSDLPESDSWPGPGIWRRDIQRFVFWQKSNRRVLVTLLNREEENALRDRIYDALSKGEVDFAVVICFEKTAFRAEHTAIWEVPLPLDSEEISILREFLATKQIASALKPSNPADAPLVQVAREWVQRLKPVAFQAALSAFYAGNFKDTAIVVDSSIGYLRRFDKLLDAAGHVLLNLRYPRYLEISPSKTLPSPRAYQRLLDEFISAGSMSIREAHAHKLYEEIEGLALPLGLAELRSGSYVFSPDIENHSLLSMVFQSMNTAGPTKLSQVLHSLQTGVFGLPDDTAYFLLAALAHGGLISLLKHDRAMALQLIRVTSVKNAEAVAPGEMIGKHDRETLINECRFLSPKGEWESFGLRQQREAWQELVKFRDWTQKTVSEVEKRLSSLAEFSAFKPLDIPSLHLQTGKLKDLSEEIKKSYPVREGLERFLKAWRTMAISSEDIDFIKNLRAFLSRHADQFVFVNHYMRHQALDQACAENQPLAELKNKIIHFLDHPGTLILEDNTSDLTETFDRFRILYADYYIEKHILHYEQFGRKQLSRFTKRAFALLQRLATIEVLDRPRGLEGFIRESEASEKAICRRNLPEELIRSPVCGCGYIPGKAPGAAAAKDPEALIETFLEEYLKILKNPGVREAIAARIFALTDADPEKSKRLRNLSKLLEDEQSPTAALLDILDDTTAEEILESLSGHVLIEKRGLKELVSSLDGRRLAPNQVMERVKEWVSTSEANTVIAIEDNFDASHPGSADSVSWWTVMHPGLFKEKPLHEIRNIESALERQFPGDTLRGPLSNLKDRQLIRFIADEMFHTQALRMAGYVFADRILSGKPWPATGTIESRHANPDIAAGISKRLQTLEKLPRLLNETFPERLCTRISLSEILVDPWTGPELLSSVYEKIRTLEKSGADWLSLLPPVEPISLDDRPLVVILDGIAPDVWLEAARSSEGDIGKGNCSWYRLEGLPKTASSISELFGFSGDALDEFSILGVPYLQLKGNEIYGMKDLLPPFAADKPAVIRISLVDTGAHATTLRLNEMPAALTGFLDKEMPHLLKICSKELRSLILTTDHGLSLTRKGLSHGKGGVFEQAIFRMKWSFV
ncbi:DUF6079 family protein [Thermodesulfobacteriota bacterium]